MEMRVVSLQKNLNIKTKFFIFKCKDFSKRIQVFDLSIWIFYKKTVIRCGALTSQNITGLAQLEFSKKEVERAGGEVGHQT